MNRRNFLKTVGLGGASLLLTGRLLHAAGTKEVSDLPNIVYILADDLGYGDVSALNPESKIPTPNIDRLAADGMRFTDAHSGSAVCTPTRYGILTGRYCWRSRLKRGVLMGFDRHLIEDGRLTVATLLKRKGYHTACFGKWHLGMDLPTINTEKPSAKNIDWKGTIEQGPTTKGFDRFYGISASLDMPPFIYIENNRFVGECTTEKKYVRKGPAQQDFEAVDVLPEIQRQAVSYIESQDAGTPFFAYVPLTAPHTPVVPSKPFQGRNMLGGYGDFCMQVDAVVGEICKAIDRKGLRSNTLVIFASDNGCAPYIGVKDLEKKGHFPSYVYRGYKADIFEGGHRIPFMVRWPGRVKAASQSNEILCLTDLMATVAAIIGEKLPLDAGEDSYNMLPAMLGQALSKPIREATIHHSINGSFSIRQGSWKLELCPGSGGWSDPKPGKATKGLPPEQLYDLTQDVGETTNVHDKYPDVVAHLKSLLEKYQKEGRSVRL